MKTSMNQATMLSHDTRIFLDAISKAGFEGVELRINKVLDFIKKESIEALIRIIKDKSLDLLSLNSVVLPLLESPSESFFKDFENICNVSHRLESPYIVTIPCTVPKNIRIDRKEVIENCIKVVKRLSEIAWRVGINIIVEPLGFKERALRRLEDGVEVVKRINRDNVYTMLDTFHIYVAGSSLECLKDVKDKIALVHISDTYITKNKDELTNDDRLLPGYGDLDLKSMINFVKSLGYNYYISIESFRKEYWNMDPYEFAKKAYESLKPFL